MQSKSFTVPVTDEITRRGIIGLTVALYYYGVTIDSTTGTITGTLAVPASGEDVGTVIAVDKGNGQYQFNNIVKGRYTVVISGFEIMTQVLKGWEDVQPFSLLAGDEIPSSENDDRSIKTVLNEVIGWINTQDPGAIDPIE